MKAPPLRQTIPPASMVHANVVIGIIVILHVAIGLLFSICICYIRSSIPQSDSDSYLDDSTMTTDSPKDTTPTPTSPPPRVPPPPLHPDGGFIAKPAPSPDGGFNTKPAPSADGGFNAKPAPSRDGGFNVPQLSGSKATASRKTAG